MPDFPDYMNGGNIPLNSSTLQRDLLKARAALTNLYAARIDQREPALLDIDMIRRNHRSLTITLGTQFISTLGQDKEYVVKSIARINDRNIARNDLFKAVAFVEAGMQCLRVTFKRPAGYESLVQAFATYAPSVLTDARRCFGRPGSVQAAYSPTQYKL